MMLHYLCKIVNVIVNSLIYRTIKMEILYAWIGMISVFDDIKNKKHNKHAICIGFDKCALVTGGARGIGTGIVKKLLECNMHVIVACRNVNAGKEAVERIRSNGVNSGSFKIFQLDLSSLSSIREFSEKIHKAYSKIDVLVNNAGIMFPPYRETEDGFESQWGINYLGPFLLTHLMMPLLKRASETNPARIINVSSSAHYLCKKLKLDKVNDKTDYVKGESYAQSKAAQIMFSMHLSKSFKAQNLKIAVFAVHPGVVNSDLFNGQPIKIILPWLVSSVFKSIDEGATSVTFACISQSLNGKSGLYLSNCIAREPSRLCCDEALQSKLFEYSLNELNIQNFGSG